MPDTNSSPFVQVLWTLFWLPARAMDRFISILLRRVLSPVRINCLLGPDVIERYEPVVTAASRLALNKHEGVWCLDVGGGPGGIARFLARPDATRTVVCDLNREALKQAQVIAAGMPVLADATRLPFADNSFPAVVCVHALEHIPDGDARTMALSEMLRVTNDAILIEGPFGKHAEDLSKLFIRTLQCLGRPVNPVALEHLTCGIPDVDQVVSVLARNEVSFVMRRNQRVEYVAALLAHVPFLRYLTGSLWHHFLIRYNDRPPFVEAFISSRAIRPTHEE